MTNNRNDNVNTRNLVVDILLAVTRDGEFSHIAIRDVLDKYRYLPKQDRAFITRLSQGTLERMIELDAIINQFSKTKVKKMKPVIAAILRSGVYQLKYMDSVPDSAACNEAVKLTVKRGFSGLKGFVNGVMRNIARNLDQIKLPDADKEPEKYLSVRYSVPEWIVARFIRQYGKEACASDFGTGRYGPHFYGRNYGIFAGAGNYRHTKPGDQTGIIPVRIRSSG